MIRVVSFRFRLKFWLKLVGLCLAGTAVFLLLFFIAAGRELERDYAAVLESLHETQRSLASITLASTFSLILVACGLTIFVSLYASHKVVGPLVRLKRRVSEVTEGSLGSALHFRIGDECRALESAFNTMVKSISGKIERFQELHRELQLLEKELQEKIASPSSSEAELAVVLQRSAEVLRGLTELAAPPNGK